MERKFRPNQLVLLYNSRLRLFPRKFKSKWSGSFIIKSLRTYRAIQIKDLKTKNSWIVNAQRLKEYQGGDPDIFTTKAQLNELWLKKRQAKDVNKSLLGGSPTFYHNMTVAPFWGLELWRKPKQECFLKPWPKAQTVKNLSWSNIRHLQPRISMCKPQRKPIKGRKLKAGSMDHRFSCAVRIYKPLTDFGERGRTKKKDFSVKKLLGYF